MPDITRISSPLLEKLPMAVMMADVSGRIVYGNPRACVLTGYSATDLAETRLGRLFPDRAVDATATLAMPTTQDGCTTLRRKDGLGMPVRLYRESISWDGGLYELVALLDRTEEEQTREDAEISALIVQATDRGILVLDPQYRITHANRALTDLLGMEPAALHDAPFGTLLSGGESDIATLRQFRRNLARRTGFEQDIHTRGKQGKDLWLRCAVTPHYGADGQLADIIVILHDITHDRQLRELQRDVVEALTDQLSLREMLDFMCRRIELIAPDCMAVVMLGTGGVLRTGGHGALPMPVLQAFDGLEASTAVGACGTAIVTAQDVVVPDFTTETRWPALRDVAGQHGIVAEWAVPIILRNGDVAGSFSLYFRAPGQPGAWHRRIVGACVHLAMLAIEQQRSRDSIIRLSYTDRLTSLPNRMWLNRRMQELSTRPSTAPLSIMVIDLDRLCGRPFKRNTSYCSPDVISKTYYSTGWMMNTDLTRRPGQMRSYVRPVYATLCAGHHGCALTCQAPISYRVLRGTDGRTVWPELLLNDSLPITSVRTYCRIYRSKLRCPSFCWCRSAC
ncbi:PAS domain-containing protein [Komagataeibacter europaeus]|uniref:PAS domain-containing protein n=1 Tax=Komagataeibacter europaeus TaxID=33995 RepID=UPI001E31A44B|nr:PAS domain-containing protein [Komagataeibacter europaeus]